MTKGWIERSIQILKEQLKELDEVFDIDSDSAQHKPHLVKKRAEIISALEAAEKLLESLAK